MAGQSTLMERASIAQHVAEQLVGFDASTKQTFAELDIPLDVPAVCVAAAKHESARLTYDRIMRQESPTVLLATVIGEHIFVQPLHVPKYGAEAPGGVEHPERAVVNSRMTVGQWFELMQSGPRYMDFGVDDSALAMSVGAPALQFAAA